MYMRCVVYTEDDACRVCCLQNNSCTPLVGVTESLEDGVPCIGDEGRNGTCIDVSEVFVCM